MPWIQRKVRVPRTKIYTNLNLLDDLEKIATPGPWEVQIGFNLTGKVASINVKKDTHATGVDLAFMECTRDAVRPLLEELKRLREIELKYNGAQ